VMWKHNGYRENFIVEVWIQPRGVVAPYPAPTIKRSKVRLINCKRSRQGRQSRGKS
jgi:hypothetical protein